jgi:hypothetical protein
MITIYHRTRADIAKSIVATGFQDGHGYFMTNIHHGGVWFSDRPLDSNEGAFRDTLICVRVDEREIERFEWIEEGKPYREWLIPARIVNALGPITIHDA